MAYGLVGLYALYFIFVGVNKNAASLYNEVQADTKGFAPWLLAIIVLKAMNEVEAIQPAVKPFIGLAILSFSLRHYNTIAGEVEKITSLDLGANQQ